MLRLVPPLRQALLLLAQALAELVLELDQLFHELCVESFLLPGELPLGALALTDFPLLDARELRLALLFERRNHRVDAKREPTALIRHPSLDPFRGLLDGALELFARRRAKRILRLHRCHSDFGNRGLGSLDLRRPLVRRVDVVGRLEAVGVFVGGRKRDLRSGAQAQTKRRWIGLWHPAHVIRLRGTPRRTPPTGPSFI